MTAQEHLKVVIGDLAFLLAQAQSDAARLAAENEQLQIELKKLKEKGGDS